MMDITDDYCQYTEINKTNDHGLIMPKRLGPKEKAVLINEFLSGKRDKLEFFLKSGGTPDLRDENGRTLLINSTINADLDSISYLISLGANPHLQDNTHMTALNYAVMARNNQAVEALNKASRNFDKTSNKHLPSQSR